MLWSVKGRINVSASSPHANIYGRVADFLSAVYVYEYFNSTDLKERIGLLSCMV